MFTKKDSYSLEQKSSLNLEYCKKDDEQNFIPKGRSNKIYKAFLSIFYITLQAISVQSISVIVKKLTYISICQLSLTRFTGILCTALPLSIIYNENILGEKNDRFLIVLRGLLQGTGICLHIAAYRYLDLVEVSIVRCTNPFLTSIIACMLLKEPFGKIQAATLLITICGVLLSLRLPKKLNIRTLIDFDASFVVGLILAGGSALCFALGAVVIRKLKDVHFSIMGLYLGFIGMIENGILNATIFPLVSINCGWDQLLCVLIGYLGVCADGFLTLALHLEPAGIVAVEKSCSEVLVATIFGILFFSEYLDMYVIFGALLVIISLSIIGVKNWILTLPESSKTRQKFKWILT